MARGRTLGDLGEHQILAKVLGPRYAGTPGFGDDCAVLGAVPGVELVATTDTCPTPVVALLGDTDPHHAGWLLATINLSDLAAAGATTLRLVVNYTLPQQTPVADFERLLDGVDAAATAHGTRVVGGDLRDGDSMLLSATAIGQCVPGRRLSRQGASAGDHLVLLGAPGYLWATVLLARGMATLPDDEATLVRRRACRPMAQVLAGQVLAAQGLAHAAMDVSAGLHATVRALCAVNGLGARMHGDVNLGPVLESVCDQAGISTFDLAATWGDWCLLTAMAPDDVALAREKLFDVPPHDIGTLVEPAGGITLDGGAGPAPWHGVAQERFSERSWHGDFDTWLRCQLGID
jgi:thiamine-monophosphate kinase